MSNRCGKGEFSNTVKSVWSNFNWGYIRNHINTWPICCIWLIFICSFLLSFLLVLSLNKFSMQLWRPRITISLCFHWSLLLLQLMMLLLGLISFIVIIAFSRAHEGLRCIRTLNQLLLSSLFVSVDVDINTFLLLRI